jgi:phospholipid-binding lipoprotein MlaA
MNTFLRSENSIETSWIKRLCFSALLLLCLGLTACASGPNANPKDPMEPFNRSMFKFNDAVDQAVLKPVATAYQDVTPKLVRQGVGNFFANLADAWSFVNNVLQLKVEGAASSLMRVGFNTVFGLGGILDVATELKLERFPEDFGQTLGHWGVGAGPYVVLPLLGPSTLRDTVALPVDLKGDAVSQVSENSVRYTLLATRVVSQRAGFLSAESIVDEGALDKYSFIRDAYLQRRQNAVYDGNPPDEASPDDVEPVEAPAK